MKIVIIRHAKVNMEWEKRYDSALYDLACKKYDTSDIVPISEIISSGNSVCMIYISELSRSYKTAYKLFGRTDFCRTSLINEVPLRSFKDTKKKYPLWIWDFIGRLQWLFNNKRQPETRTLIKELRSKGYKIENRQE